MRPVTSTEHGQHGYARKHKCRCDPCVLAQRRYTKARKYDADTGNPRKVPAGPVREHLQRLLDSGVSIGQIAAATGYRINKEQTDRILTGASRRVYRATAQAILAVTREAAMEATYTYVDGTGVHRRIEALRWLGYSLPTLSEHLPIGYSALHLLTKRNRVRTTTVKMIDDLYRKLANTVGPDERERWRAYRAGFAPPAAWEDETIDDPSVQPDLKAIRCIVGDCSRGVHKMSLCYSHWRRCAEAEVLDSPQRFKAKVLRLGRSKTVDAQRLREEVAEMRAQGMTMQGTAARLGRSLNVVEKIWREVG